MSKEKTILFLSAEFGIRNLSVPHIKGQYRTERLTNGGLVIKMETPVKGANCVVLGNIGPKDENLLEMLLLCHTIQKEQPRSVSLFTPYLPYALQDKNLRGESWGARWFGRIAKPSGVDKAITIDAHSDRLMSDFDIPLVSLSPAPCIAAEIERRGIAEFTLVAPDKGALLRCKAVQDALTDPPAFAYFAKEHKGGQLHSTLTGPVSDRVVLIDDILDTGATLISACRVLQAAGVKEIYVFVTHGIFSGESWKELWELGVRDITTFDTFPARLSDERLSTLSLVPLFERYLTEAEANSNDSINARG